MRENKKLGTRYYILTSAQQTSIPKNKHPPLFLASARCPVLTKLLYEAWKRTEKRNTGSTFSSCILHPVYTPALAETPTNPAGTGGLFGIGPVPCPAVCSIVYLPVPLLRDLVI